MKNIISCMLILILADMGYSADPWPAEEWTKSTILTQLDPAFKNNMSGAFYNPVTETFWVCCNGGPSAFWAIKKDDKGNWGIASKGGKRAKYSFGKGDFEDICQVDYNSDVVYLIEEGAQKVVSYNVGDYGNAIQINQWDISKFVPSKAGLGPEGITFVPDEWLLNGNFTDPQGKSYTSLGGMGGIMLVAHQDGGHIYAFDLSLKTQDVKFVGMYGSSRGDSSGLAFDRSVGLLYIWHNIGDNYLELAQLKSSGDAGSRRFVTITEFTGPKSGNLEGFAITPMKDNTSGLCLLVDDDNHKGAAVMMFNNFDFTKIPTAR